MIYDLACTPRPAPFETDEDLLDYCELHCRTPVALFSREQIERVVALAGVHVDLGARGWVQVHEEAMMPVIELARTRLRGSR